jgi:chromosome segregation ATPase
VNQLAARKSEIDNLNGQLEAANKDLGDKERELQRFGGLLDNKRAKKVLLKKLLGDKEEEVKALNDTLAKKRTSKR